MQRRHDLDWVRVCAFALLVLYHVGMYYVSWEWHVDSPHASTTLEPFMMMSSPWRLSLLFLVSGVATAFLLAKSRAGDASNGRSRFIGPRSWRLLVPLVFGMLVIVPPQSYYEVVEKLPGGFHDGYLAFWGRYLAADDSFCRGDDCLRVPTWNHLWFVAYLWVYTVAVWLLARGLPESALERVASRVAGALASGTGILLWPILFFAIARIALIGVFGSTHALVDDGYNHVQYFGIFLLGFMIARADSVWASIGRVRWIALALWLLSWLAIVAYFEWFRETPPPHALRLAMRGAWGLNQWCAIVAILGFARQLAPGDSPALRYLSTAIFPVYILHQTVTVVLAHNAKPLGLAPLVEGPLLVVLTFGLCFAGYEAIRRIPPLRPLFGLQFRERRS